MIRVTDPRNSPILARLKVWRERATVRRFEDEKDVVLAMQTLGEIASYGERFGASRYYDECKAILRDKITRSKGGAREGSRHLEQKAARQGCQWRLVLHVMPWRGKE